MNTCSCDACCVPAPAGTPLPVTNRPGLPALARRVSTHGAAKAAMLRGLTRPDLPALADLRTRTDDDLAIALLDAGAVAADNLAFYTELLANECYLRTATEHRSLMELARLVDYEVRPPLAASLDLAFTVTRSAGGSALVDVPARTAAQSTPDQGGQPVVFETLSHLRASPAWNRLRARARVPHPTTPPPAADGTVLICLAGEVRLTAGDGVLYRSGATLAFGLVSGVRVVDAVPDLPDQPGTPARTEVRVTPVPSRKDGTATGGPAAAAPAPVPSAWAWAGTTVDADDLASELAGRGLSVEEMADAFAAPAGSPAEAWVFPARSALFGATAPSAASILGAALSEALARGVSAPSTVHSWITTQALGKLPWEDATIATFPVAANEVYLDGDVPVEAGGAVVLRDRDAWGCYPVTSATPEGIAAHGISGRATRVTVGSTTGLSAFRVRRTTAFTGLRRVPLADVPAPAALPVDRVELDGLHLGLTSGRRIVVSGATLEDTGQALTHATTLARVEHHLVTRTTTVWLTDFLPLQLRRDSVVIAGNVAAASAGQSRDEVLGSGDAQVPFQRFVLRQPPLTYLPEASTRGRASTLEVWVDGVRWTRVDTLLEAGADDRVYVTREHEGSTVVEFGDGVTGSRLPTGAANVTAVYRSGGGSAGRVRPGQVTMLMTRPAGVTGVWNPGPGTGGVDAETVAAARVNAPLRVLTIDRVVSLADHAAFARAFPGVAKAHAVWARSGDTRGVLLTVAGEGGDPVGPATPIGEALLGALRASGDPRVPVHLLPYRRRTFRVHARVRTAEDRRRADVLADATAALRDRFSFGSRELGQPVATSAVVAAVQQVRGVVAVTVTRLWALTPGAPTDPPDTPPSALLTAQGTTAGDQSAGAELLVLDPAPIPWEVLP